MRLRIQDTWWWWWGGRAVALILTMAQVWDWALWDFQPLGLRASWWGGGHCCHGDGEGRRFQSEGEVGPDFPSQSSS